MHAKAVTTWGLAALIAGLVQWPGVARAQEFFTQEPDPVTYAEVTVDTLNVRAAPDKEAENLAQLKKGDLVPVKSVKDGWVRLAWSNKAYVFEGGVRVPDGKVNRRPKYEQMREDFIRKARELDPTIVWLEAPRASGLTVRFHWREYRDKDALVKRCQELARLYSVMTTGESGIAVDILNGNDLWARAFY
jgi:uncharacterized protein YgiM (DUF1202 family)